MQGQVHNVLVTSNLDVLSNKCGYAKDASSNGSTTDEAVPWMPANLLDASSTEENQSAQSIQVPAAHCVNCGYTFSGEEKYCAECGRKREITSREADDRPADVDNPEDEALAAAVAASLQDEIDVATGMQELRIGNVVRGCAHARGLVVHDNATVSIAWEDASDANAARVNADWVQEGEELRIDDIVEPQITSEIPWNLPAHARGLVTAVHGNGTVSIAWQDSSDAHDSCVYADWVRKVKEPLSITIKFNPGLTGVEYEIDSGRILEVRDGQAKNAGVKVGWQITMVDGMNYTDELWREKRAGFTPYALAFAHPEGAWRIVKQQPIDFFVGNNEWHQAQDADVRPIHPPTHLAASVAASSRDETDLATAMKAKSKTIRSGCLKKLAICCCA